MKLPKQFIKNINTDKISLSNQTYIFVNLSDLLKMGVSVRKSLEFLQIMNPKITGQLGIVIKGLNDGLKFEEAFKPFISTDVYYQIQIANQHGSLQETLESIGKIFASRNQQMKKLKALVQYPIFLLIFLAVMMIGMKCFIMPELGSWDFNTATWQSRLIKAVIGLLSIIFVGLSYVGWRKFKQKTATNKVLLICRLPIIGQIYQLYCQYYLTTNLALLVKSGMQLGSITNYLVSLQKDSLLYHIGQKIQNHIKKGNALADFIQKGALIPNELELLLQKGSDQVTLAKEINALAQMKYKALISKMERLILVVQPILFGVVGVSIVLMYLNLLMPMYNSMKEVTM